MSNNYLLKGTQLLGESRFGAAQDAIFMSQALRFAEFAYDQDEVPIGAVVVSEGGEVIGRGYNQVELQHCQLAHAESIAIEQATGHMGDWRLDRCWVFVTLEPCCMCMSLIRLSRCEGVVYGATSPLFGYHLDNIQQSPVYKRGTFVVVNGILQQQSSALLQRFFQKKRKNNSD